MSSHASGRRPLSIVHVLAPVEFGGGEALIRAMAQEARGIARVSVAALFDSGPFESALREAGARHFALSPGSPGHGRSRWAMALQLWRLPAWLAQLRRIVRAENVDVVHCHGFPASALGALLRSLVPSRTAFVYTHHNDVGPVSAVQRFAFRRILSRFDACTTVSEVCRARLDEAYGGAVQRFRTIHNCVDAAFFSNPASRLRPAKHGKVRAVHVGRFVAFKNQRLIVEALSRLPDAARARLEVTLVGDGPLRKEIEDLAQRLGVSPSVRFAGFIPHRELPRFLEAFDFAIMPSLYEGFGIAAVECMAGGLPVLSLDIPIMEEVVADGGMRVAASRFEEGLAAMIERCEQLRFAATRRAGSFRPSATWARYRELYGDVSRGRDSRGAERAVLALSLGRRGGCVKYADELLRRWRGAPLETWVSSYCAETVSVPHRAVRTYRGPLSFAFNSFTALVPMVAHILLTGRRRYSHVYFPYFHYWALPLALAAKLRGIPVCLTVHDGRLHAADGLPLEQWLNDRSVRAADRLVFLSRFVASTTVDRLRVDRPRAVIPHGVFDRSTVREPRRFPRGRPVRLLFFGRINRYKGVEMLQAAFLQVRQRFDVTLTIAGAPGYAFERIAEATYECGFLPEERVDQLFRDHDVLVMPYVEATQSGVATQAIASLMPTVVTRVGGLAEQLTEEEAVVVEPGVAGIAGGIERLLADPHLYEALSMRLAARRRAASWQDIADAVRDFVLEESPAEVRASA